MSAAEVFGAAAICALGLLGVLAFTIFGCLYIGVAREEHAEGKHGAAFWGFGLGGCLILALVVCVVAAFVSSVVASW